MANTTQPPTQYSVSVWEGIAIAIGAIGLVMAALLGLVVKVTHNSFEPQRAEAIANSLMDYEIPGGSYGVFGVNIGGLRTATIRSSSSTVFPKGDQQGEYSIPEVELLIVEAPINDQSKEDDPGETPKDNLSSSYQVETEFKATTSRTENKPFCGMDVSVTIQEGLLTLTNSQSSVLAIQYNAKAVFKNTQRSVLLTTTGQTAKQKAVAVFNSLKCKQ